MRDTLKNFLFETVSTYCKKKDPKAIAEWI
jgi:hypothetical protein